MKEMLANYRKRLVKESVIKSLMVGASIGLACLFGLSLWFYLVPELLSAVPYGIYWLPIVAFSAVAAGVSVLFYFLCFKPSTSTVAKRLDELGLEERTVTMMEFMDDDSYMAQRQREDAANALKNVKAEMLNLAVPARMIVCAALSFVLGVGAYSANLLADNGLIPGGKEFLSGLNPDVAAGEIFEYEVAYEVYGEGEIMGELVQIVEAGKDSEPIYAEAADGWVFAGWVYADGTIAEGYSPDRQELAVQENIFLYAYFVELGDAGDQPGGNDQRPGDKPGDSSENNKPKDPGQPSDGDSDNTDPGEGGGAGGVGRGDQVNQIINGNTYYGDEQGSAQQDAMESLSGNSNVSDSDKQAVSDYYNAISENVGKGDSGSSGEQP